MQLAAASAEDDFAAPTVAPDQQPQPGQPEQERTAERAGVRALAAARQGDFGLTQEVLRTGETSAVQSVLDVRDEAGRTLLHWAALCGEETVTEELLRRASDARSFAEVRASDTQQTALHWAAVKSNLRILWLLRRAGADLRTQDSLGASAAVLAVQHGNLEALLLLLHWDATAAELVDLNGCSAVHWAAYKTDVKALRVLQFALEGRTALEEADKQGMTAVHRAVSSGECVRFLVEEGLVDPLRTNNLGQKASELARNNGQPRVAAYLDKFEEKKNGGYVELTQETRRRRLADKVHYMQSLEKQKNFLLPLVYWIFAASVLFSYLFVLKSSSLVFTLFAAPSLASYLWLMLGDPGHRKRRLKGSSAIEQFQQVLDRRASAPAPAAAAAAAAAGAEELELESLCLSCRDWKSLRTKHCSKCGKCCDGFDHCCPWINNDVASKNHRLFILMLLCNVVALSAFSVCLIADLPGDEFFVIRMFLSAVQEPLLFALLVVDLFFLPFAALLLFTQLRIVATNMNTNELLNLHRYSHFWQPQQPQQSNSSNLAKEQGQLVMNHLQAVAFVNPFDKGVMQNCLHFWTGDVDKFSAPNPLDGFAAKLMPRRIANFKIKKVFDACCDHDHGHGHSHGHSHGHGQDGATSGDIELGGLGPRRSHE